MTLLYFFLINWSEKTPHPEDLIGQIVLRFSDKKCQQRNQQNRRSSVKRQTPVFCPSGETGLQDCLRILLKWKYNMLISIKTISQVSYSQLIYWERIENNQLRYCTTDLL